MNKVVCSFCGRERESDGRIIIGRGVFICDFCINICKNILISDPYYNKNEIDNDFNIDDIEKRTPKEIKSYLDEYIVGQEETKKILSISVYNHYKRIINNYYNRNNDNFVYLSKSNILLIGETGSGKTLLARTLANCINVPFSISDATTLTEAGYVGEDVESILYRLYQASDYNIRKAEIGIIYIDEIDKIARRNDSTNRDVSGEGVQQALLKIIEGTISNLQIRGNRRYPSQDTIQINTSNILFICGGAFNGLNYLQSNNIKKIGFNNLSSSYFKNTCDNNSLPKELIKFGLIPEFVGRLSIISVLERIKKKDLIKILLKTKNSIIKQYELIFKMEGIEIEFKNNLIKKIAYKAAKFNLGVRGIKHIIEKKMLKLMYKISKCRNITKIILGKGFLKKNYRPKIFFEGV